MIACLRSSVASRTASPKRAFRRWTSSFSRGTGFGGASFGGAAGRGGAAAAGAAGAGAAGAAGAAGFATGGVAGASAFGGAAATSAVLGAAGFAAGGVAGASAFGGVSPPPGAPGGVPVESFSEGSFAICRLVGRAASIVNALLAMRSAAHFLTQPQKQRQRNQFACMKKDRSALIPNRARLSYKARCIQRSKFPETRPS